MTTGGYNFNDFPENRLTKFRAVQTVLRKDIVHGQGFVGLSPPQAFPRKLPYEQQPSTGNR